MTCAGQFMFQNARFLWQQLLLKNKNENQYVETTSSSYATYSSSKILLHDYCFIETNDASQELVLT